MITVPRTISQYPLRSREGRKGNREHSAPTTATSSASKVCHPSQLLIEQTHPSCGDQILWSHQIHESAGGCQAAALRPLSPSLKDLSSSYPPYLPVKCGRGHPHPSHFGAP
eukprot:140458-Pelagomonas_calceolata.AAC.2